MKILLLAGTSEARALAAEMADDPKINVIASLAGVTRAPLDIPVPTRTGGFGGRAAFAAYLAAENIDVVVDATHPFAARISQRTCEVAQGLGLPYLQVLRPEWQPQDGDIWAFIADESAAAAHIPKGDVVFLATGRQTLARFDNLTGRRLICRQIERTEGSFPFENGEYLIGRPPFSVEQEVALFRKLGVNWLVVKNAGGNLSRTKLDAARLLQIPVLMIRRPLMPDCARVETVQGALDWLRAI